VVQSVDKTTVVSASSEQVALSTYRLPSGEVGSTYERFSGSGPASGAASLRKTVGSLTNGARSTSRCAGYASGNVPCF
jgi:hypothetical protein